MCQNRTILEVKNGFLLSIIRNWLQNYIFNAANFMKIIGDKVKYIKKTLG